MAHDVFISYSTQDKSVADGMCHHLEARRIRCWIAPRDVAPGATFAGSIVKAIRESRAMVLVYSDSSNRSPHVLSEVNTAVAKGVMIIPFRIEDAALSEDMEYYLGAPHWLDALTQPIEIHLDRLCDRIDALLKTFPSSAHEAAETAKSKFAPAETAAPKIPPDPLALQLQQVKEAEAWKQAEALAAVRIQLAGEIKSGAFAEAHHTVGRLLALQPDDADAEAARALVERELEAESKRREEEARRQEEIERRRLEQRQREAEERRRKDEEERQREAERRREEQEQREAAKREQEQRITTLRQQLKNQLQQGACAEAQTTVSLLEALGCGAEETTAARSSIAKRLAEQARIARFEVCPGGKLNNGTLDVEFGLAFGPDFTSKLSFSEKSYCRVGTLYGHRWQVECIAAFPGGTRLVSGASDGGIIVWDIREGVTSGTIEFHLKGHSAQVNCLALSPGGRYVFSGGCDGLIAIWKLEIQKCVRVLEDKSSEYLQAISILSDGRRLVSASRGIKIWDLMTGKGLHHLDLGYTVNCVALHPDGVHAIAGADASTIVWDLETGLKIREIPQGAQSLAVLPDGRVILVHAMHPGVSVWNSLSGNLFLNVKGVKGKSQCVAMSPDGRRAVSGMDDGRVVIWDINSGKELHTFDRDSGHREAVTSIAAFATEKYLLAASGSLDRNIALWRLP